MNHSNARNILSILTGMYEKMDQEEKQLFTDMIEDMHPGNNPERDHALVQFILKLRAERMQLNEEL